MEWSEVPDNPKQIAKRFVHPRAARAEKFRRKWGALAGQVRINEADMLDEWKTQQRYAAMEQRRIAEFGE